MYRAQVQANNNRKSKAKVKAETQDVDAKNQTLFLGPNKRATTTTNSNKGSQKQNWLAVNTHSLTHTHSHSNNSKRARESKTATRARLTGVLSAMPDFLKLLLSITVPKQNTDLNKRITKIITKKYCLGSYFIVDKILTRRCLTLKNKKGTDLTDLTTLLLVNPFWNFQKF